MGTHQRPTVEPIFARLSCNDIFSHCINIINIAIPFTDTRPACRLLTQLNRYLAAVRVLLSATLCGIDTSAPVPVYAVNGVAVNEQTAAMRALIMPGLQINGHLEHVHHVMSPLVLHLT